MASAPPPSPRSGEPKPARDPGGEPARSYDVGASGARVGVPAAVVTAMRWVRVSVALDLVMVALAVSEMASLRRGMAYVIFLGGLWAIGAFAAAGRERAAMQARMLLGFVAFSLLLLAFFGLHRDEGRSRIVWALAAVIAVHGSVACLTALRVGRRARGESAGQPGQLGLRLVVSVIGVVWIACGIVETWWGNWWLGLVVISVGALVLILARELIAESHTDARVGGPGRGGRLLRVFGLGLLCPVLLIRAFWLLAHSVGDVYVR